MSATQMHMRLNWQLITYKPAKFVLDLNLTAQASNT